MFVHGLDHVDQRQRPHGHSSERLHLHTRAVSRADRRGQVHAGVNHHEVDLDGVDADRVSQGDQVGCAFGRLDPRDAGNGERVALGHTALSQGSHGSSRKQHTTDGGRRTDRDVLGRDVDHVRRTVGAHVGQMRLRHGASTIGPSGWQRTWSPALTNVTSAGMTASAFAPARLPSACEPCSPAMATVYPERLRESTTRANWTLPSGAFQSWAATAVTRGDSCWARPAISLRAGATNTSNETIALTGLPGRVNTGTSSSPRTPKPCGMPGYIATLSKRTVPTRESTSLTVSKAPMLTPPVVITASARSSWLSIVVRTVWASSRTQPMRNGMQSRARTAAVSMRPLLSTTWPNPGRVPGSMSSSPVEMTTTRGLGVTMTRPLPTAASRAIWRGSRRVPERITKSPAVTSSPAWRTLWPTGTAAKTVTLARPPSVRSTGMTTP